MSAYVSDYPPVMCYIEVFRKPSLTNPSSLLPFFLRTKHIITPIVETTAIRFRYTFLDFSDQDERRRRRRPDRDGRGTVQSDRADAAGAAGARPFRPVVPCRGRGSGAAGVRVAGHAAGRAVLRAQRLPAVRQHGRAGHQRPDEPVQGPRAGREHGPRVGHAAPDAARVRHVQRPGRGSAAPGGRRAAAAAPRVLRVQLPDAGHVDIHAVLHARPRAHGRARRHRGRVPHDRQQPVDTGAAGRLQRVRRLGRGVRGRGAYGVRQRVRLGAVRLLPDHHVLRAQRSAPYHVGRVREARRRR